VAGFGLVQAVAAFVFESVMVSAEQAEVVVGGGSAGGVVFGVVGVAGAG
jgi:hypothetical protein